MAEMVMVVDPPAPIASISALPPAPKLLPIIMTINSNGRISLYLKGTLAQQKQGPAYGLMLKRPAI